MKNSTKGLQQHQNEKTSYPLIERPLNFSNTRSIHTRGLYLPCHNLPDGQPKGWFPCLDNKEWPPEICGWTSGIWSLPACWSETGPWCCQSVQGWLPSGDLAWRFWESWTLPEPLTNWNGDKTPSPSRSLGEPPPGQWEPADVAASVSLPVRGRPREPSWWLE